jgi:hypothetical protein
MNTQDTPDNILDGHIKALRQELEGIDAPRCVEKELLQAFAKQFPPKKRWYQKLARTQWAAIGATFPLAALALLLALGPQRPDPDAGVRGQPLVGIDNGMAFVALEPLERIALEPQPRMVEAEVPRTMLAPLGVAVTPENAGDTVLAEMLVAADGQPLALRFSNVN